MIVADCNEAGAKAVAERIEQHGGRAVAFAGDATRATGCPLRC